MTLRELNHYMKGFVEHFKKDLDKNEVAEATHMGNAVMDLINSKPHTNNFNGALLFGLCVHLLNTWERQIEEESKPRIIN